MSIADWPAAERPREKLLEKGPQALSDAELLAIFFRTGIRGKSALDLARELLSRFGSLPALMEARPAVFYQHPGLGPAKYAQLQAVLELCKRYLAVSLREQTVFEQAQQTRAFLSAHMRGHQREVFACLFLDNRHRLLRFEELFHGTIDSAAVHPREVVKRALECNAAAIIVAHNHPSGMAEPSNADRQITQKLRSALALVDIRLLDHFVIGHGEIISFAERGLL